MQTQTKTPGDAFLEGAERCPDCGLAFMYHSGGHVPGGLICMFPNGKVRWPVLHGGYMDDLGRYYRSKD